MTKHLPYLIACSLVLVLATLLFGPAIRNEVTAYLLMRQDSPDEAAVHSVINSASHPDSMISRLWKTQRIPHRYMALSYLNSHATLLPKISKPLDKIIGESIVNVDNNVRELALGFLSASSPNSLNEPIKRLLHDTDLELRILALNSLRQAKNQELIAEIIRLLDDPEPKVAATAAGVLRRWTGEDFGVRSQDAIPRSQADDHWIIPAENLQRLRLGLKNWKQWWTTANEKYPPLLPMEQSVTPPKLPTQDFQLEDVEGRPTTLSEFRGKTVVLNFWTSWCTACAVEVPDLVKLHSRHPGDLVILAISLDGAYGHGGDLDTFVDSKEVIQQGWNDTVSLENSNDQQAAAKTPNIPKIREKLGRVIRRMGINYRVLLDPSGNVGNRFNGQELPTNVLIDKDGFVRRRFLGSRPLSNWEALIAEIQ